MDISGKYCCTLSDLEEFKKEIVKCEGKTVQEVMHLSHNHPLSVDKIDQVAKKRLDTLKLEIETLHQIKLSGCVRLWGIREDNIFHILWLDRFHEVYKAARKH
jgi:hypothetical protein